MRDVRRVAVAVVKNLEGHEGMSRADLDYRLSFDLSTLKSALAGSGGALTLRTLLDLGLPEDPIIKLDWESKTLDIYGGSCPYSEEDPYWLSFDRIATPAEAMDWMAHLTGKTWAGGGEWFREFARALLKVVEWNQGGNQ